MFGKKILSLIGLLFLGSQISSVSAGCTLTHTETSYNCSDCNNMNDDGLHLVTGMVGEESRNILVDVSSSEGVASCTTIVAPGYYLVGENVYVVDGTNNYATQATDAAEGACANGLIKDGNLCLDNENTVAFVISDERYVFNDDDKLFGEDAKIVIKANENSIVKDDSYTTDSEMCVRDSHVIYGSKNESYCKDDCAYYVFENGVATLSTIQTRANILPPVDPKYCNPALDKPENGAATAFSSYHCAAGYYIVNETPDTPIVITVDIDDDGYENGVLYYCDSNERLTKCTRLTAAEALPGYYVNAYYSTNNNVKYIQCDGEYCKGFFNDVELCENAGDIVSSNGALRLCITSGDSNPISLSESSKYFVDVASNSSKAFTYVGKDDYSIIVEIDAQKAVVPARKNDPPRKYKYANTSTAKIFDSHDDNACSTGTAVATEYELYRESVDDSSDPAKVDKYDYYKKGNTINN